MDTTGLVIYVGTFSKSLFPALRLGYLLAPPALVGTFKAIMSKFLQGVPSQTQGVVAEFIDEGHFSAHVRRMRHVYLERHEALLAAARRRLSGLLDVQPTHSGLHTIGHLPAWVSELAVAQDADQRHVTASPIGRFSLAPVATHGLVLGFGGVSPKLIDAGTEVLAEVLEKRLSASAPRKSRAGATVV